MPQDDQNICGKRLFRERPTGTPLGIPESRLRRRGVEVAIPDSRVRTRDAGVPRPESRAPNRERRVARPESRAGVASPDPACQESGVAGSRAFAFVSFLYRRRAYRGCLLPLGRGFSFDLWILRFPLTGILPCPGCPPPLSGSRPPILRHAVRSFRADAFVSPIFIFSALRGPQFSAACHPPGHLLASFLLKLCDSTA